MDEFREGSEFPGAGHVAFYRQSKERIPKTNDGRGGLWGIRCLIP